MDAEAVLRAIDVQQDEEGFWVTFHVNGESAAFPIEAVGEIGQETVRVWKDARDRALGIVA